MNKSFLKFVTDFGPLAIFFFYYYNSGKNLSVAIPPTIYFNDPIFIYVKPTIINIMFALALYFGKYFTKEPVLKKVMGKSIPLSDIGWEILNRRWMFFFFGLALLNEFVWRTQTEEFWVNFKVWGMLPITIVFTGFQVPLINKHKIDA